MTSTEWGTSHGEETNVSSSIRPHVPGFGSATGAGVGVSSSWVASVVSGEPPAGEVVAVGKGLVWVIPPLTVSTPNTAATRIPRIAHSSIRTFLFARWDRFALPALGEEGESATIFSDRTFELLELDVVNHGLN